MNGSLITKRHSITGRRRLARRDALAIAVALASVLSAHAAPERAICAVEHSIACPPLEPCARNLPGAVDLPAPLKIDRPAGVVVSRLETGTERTSPVGDESGDETSHALHGIDQGNPRSIRVAGAVGGVLLGSMRRNWW